MVATARRWAVYQPRRAAGIIPAMNVDDFKNARVLVFGDVMLDRFTTGTVDRISPEAPIPVLSDTHKRTQLGGAAAVASICAGLGAETTLISVIGDDIAGRVLADLCYETYLTPRLVTDQRRQTTVKHRILAERAGTTQTVCRIDSETTETIRGDITSDVLNLLRQSIMDADVVLVSDYGKGVCQADLLTALSLAADCRSVPVIVDPAIDADWRTYGAAWALCPNARELETQHYPPNLSARRIVTTCGANGLNYTDANQRFPVPTQANPHPVDVSGAGDTVLAMLGLCLAVDPEIEPVELLQICNAAAGVQITKQGVQQITPDELAEVLK